MKSPTHFPRVARFGVFEVDLRAGELRKHGLKIKLQDQPFQILAMLLAQPGEVVTREELRQKLWPADTFVDFDHGLNNAIKRLREALGDSAESPRYVETLPRRGYRLIVPVDEIADLKQSPPLSAEEVGRRPEVVKAQGSASSRIPPTEKTRRRHGVAIIGLGLTALLGVTIALNVSSWRKQVLARSASGQIQSLVVLPLENLSGDPAQEYFADGITDQLTTNLAQIGALRVISRTSAMQYRGTRKTLQQIAQELHVDGVVEGTVARSGDRVRINAQLIHAPTDRHIWAKSYERDQSDIVALQNDVARAVAGEIQIKLTPEQQLRLSRARAVNPEAYEEYLQGLYVLNKQVTTKTFEDAAEHFQKAIERDPGYASAHAGLLLVTLGSACWARSPRGR